MCGDLKLLIQGHKSQILRAQASHVSEKTQPGEGNVIYLDYAPRRNMGSNSSLPLGVCNVRGWQKAADSQAPGHNTIDDVGNVRPGGICSQPMLVTHPKTHS